MTARRAFHGVQARLHAIDKIALGLEFGKVRDLDKARVMLARFWARVSELDSLAKDY